MPNPKRIKAPHSTQKSAANAATGIPAIQTRLPQPSTRRLPNFVTSRLLIKSITKAERPSERRSTPISPSLTPACAFKAGMREVSIP